jgi:hypothetical protein
MTFKIAFIFGVGATKELGLAAYSLYARPPSCAMYSYRALCRGPTLRKILLGSYRQDAVKNS